MQMVPPQHANRTPGEGMREERRKSVVEVYREISYLTRNTTITCLLDTVRTEPVEARMLSPFDKLGANV